MARVGADKVTGALATMGAASISGATPSSASLLETPVTWACAVRSVPSAIPPFTVACRTSDRLSPTASAGTVQMPPA